MLTNLEQALNRVRQSGQNPDLSKGMAELFYCFENNSMHPIAIVTVAFARQFCESDPYYTWRKL